MPHEQRNLTGKLLNDLWNVGAKHALYRKDGKWYHKLTEFPGALFDANGYIVFKSEKDYRENDHLQIKQDLHIANGISSIPGYIRISEKSQVQAFSHNLKKTIGHRRINPNVPPNMEIFNNDESLKAFDLPKGKEELTRVLMQIKRIIRDTKISRSVKIIHNYRCQICGHTIDLGDGNFYAEAHHIKPLGNKHNGPDIVENVMCVCPNHHVLLDYGAIPINQLDLQTVRGHVFSETYIEYHNTTIYGNRGSIGEIV